MNSIQIQSVSSLYLHFPFCRHLCNYCDFYKQVRHSAQGFSKFHQYLEDSFNIHDEFLEENSYSWAPLETLYLGGGTPSLWGAEGARYLRMSLQKRGLRLAPSHEFTIEVNPGSFTREGLAAWQEMGVNRFSLGVQALDARFLHILDRVHTLKQTYEALDILAQLGSDFSVDFMLGLPYSEEKKRDVLSELRDVLAFSPAHLSLYILTTRKNYIHQKALPGEEWIEREYMQVSEFLQERGYEHYEVSNFARPGQHSRHNQRYWHGEPVAALGPSATGFLPFINQAVRYKWRTGTGVRALEIQREELDGRALRLEALYLSLRTRQGIDLQTFFDDDEERDRFWALASRWKEQGLAVLAAAQTFPDAIHLTSKGFLILDSLVGDALRALKSV